MVIPGAIAVFAPIIVGFILTAKGLAGCLIGSLSSGFMLAVAMSNAGGAWDNAKKFAKQLGLNKTDKDHFDATVVGDTVGDPFKDTSGPALNILIKLMSVISLVIAPALKAWQIDSENNVIEWESKSVGVGVGILIVLLIVLYMIQRYIDYGYGVKRKEVEASIKAQKDKRISDETAAVAANPAAYKALKGLKDSEKEGKLSMQEAEALLAALKNPKPDTSYKPVAPMEIEVKTVSAA